MYDIHLFTFSLYQCCVNCFLGFKVEMLCYCPHFKHLSWSVFVLAGKKDVEYMWNLETLIIIYRFSARSPIHWCCDCFALQLATATELVLPEDLVTSEVVSAVAVRVSVDAAVASALPVTTTILHASVRLFQLSLDIAPVFSS